jgi:hypothetical protein
MKATQHMTPEEFDEVAPKLMGFTGTAQSYARMVLVERVAPGEAAKAVGLSRQNAHQQMNRMMAVLNDLPKDWIFFEGDWMPASLATEVRALIAAARADLKKNNS